MHLRMFEMAKDYISEKNEFEIIGGYISPVSDSYEKASLKQGGVNCKHRVNMCEQGLLDSDWLMVDQWEAFQPVYTPTLKVIQHFELMINGEDGGGMIMNDGERRVVRIMFLAGTDLFQSFSTPGVWKTRDVNF
ncbi:hypothetical protein HK096_001754, partial [Nowakowskiella sp. JEL0078]